MNPLIGRVVVVAVVLVASFAPASLAASTNQVIQRPSTAATRVATVTAGGATVTGGGATAAVSGSGYQGLGELTNGTSASVTAYEWTSAGWRSTTARTGGDDLKISQLGSGWYWVSGVSGAPRQLAVHGSYIYPLVARVADRRGYRGPAEAIGANLASTSIYAWRWSQSGWSVTTLPVSGTDLDVYPLDVNFSWVRDGSGWLAVRSSQLTIIGA